MLDFVIDTVIIFESTIKDISPVILLIGFFQILVIKKNIPNLKKTFIGLLMLIIGLSFFLIGLEKALFPIGEMMARQLTDIEFIEKTNFSYEIKHSSYYWVYIFAGMIGFSTTIAEPLLISVASKADEVSGGVIRRNVLRISVASGVGIALTAGTYRIVSGTPLHYYLIGSFALILIMTYFTPKDLLSLAYDIGYIATSTVSIPVITALGLGLSSAIPDRDPVTDGFGLIALAAIFPIITVLIYANFMGMVEKYNKRLRM